MLPPDVLEPAKPPHRGVTTGWGREGNGSTLTPPPHGLHERVRLNAVWARGSSDPPSVLSRPFPRHYHAPGPGSSSQAL